MHRLKCNTTSSRLPATALRRRSCVRQCGTFVTSSHPWKEETSNSGRRKELFSLKTNGRWNSNKTDNQRYPSFSRYLSTFASEQLAVNDDDNNQQPNSKGNNQETEVEIAQRRIQKKRRAMHRVAIQSIPFWLKRESYCFERTVRALNLDVSSERSSSSSAAAELSAGQKYRKAFNDSIPSFAEYLTNADDDLPENVQEALDRLVDAGFSDMEFSKNYREHKTKQLLQAQSLALLQQKKRSLRQRQTTIEEIQSKVDEADLALQKLIQQRDALIQEGFPGIDASELQPKKDDSSISADAFIDNVLSFFSRNETSNVSKAQQEEIAEEWLSLEEKIQKLERQMDGRMKHIESHQQGLDNTRETIELLQQQEQSHRSPISADVFEQTQQTIHEVMLVLCDALADHILRRHSSLIEHYQNLDSKTDLTKPHEWYLLARLDKRKIIYHGGPTNSGKTYNALERLKKAKRGLYLGPLRLLAAEIYETLNSQGVYCNLITGQERTDIPFATHAAATVEMAANLLDEEYDCVVIDEIQMISDKDRGFAWTRALMGMRCKEIHVCGGLEAKELVQKIAKACNDNFSLNKYERFSTLTPASMSLAKHPQEIGSYQRVQPGDCIVAFSRNDIFSIKREIESKTPYKCCVIYGTLPPQTRTTQARLFNDPNSGYDILVASDAISMGLNLNIRRIIFNSLYKNDGDDIIRLDHSAVKQIAGRAGRRNSPFPEGEATCRDPRDLKYLTDCLNTPIDPIEKAGLVPTSEHIEVFSNALGADEDEKHNKQLHELVKEFSEMAVVKGDYFLCRQSSMYIICKWLKDIPLEARDKYQFSMAPIATNNPKGKDVIVSYAQKLAAGEVAGLTRGAALKRAVNFNDLALLCAIYSEVELFIWLQNKFPPINLMEQQAALSRKDRAALFINLGLQETDKLKLEHCYVKRDAALRARWEQVQQEKLVDDDNNELNSDDEEDVEEEGEYAVEKL